jgi:hypothetical protein
MAQNLCGFNLVTISVPANVLDQAATLSFPVNNIKQMWLHSHMVANSSFNLMRVEMRGPTAVRWREAVTNMQGGQVVFLPGSTAGQTAWFAQTVPIPLLTEHEGQSMRQLSFTIHITDQNGSQTGLTHNGLVFWFAFVEESGCKRLPETNPLLDGVTMMGTRTF